MPLMPYVVAAAAALSVAQQPQQPVPPIHERIEVVATRIPESPEEVPAAIEVFTGEELRDLGAFDLRSALALAAGVEIAPGGDAGPASAVPDFWGLKEFDAFLLVVDDVPWGGAFNPAVASVSLQDVERIEILRGPAPVTYGATSFVGVIHVVHKKATDAGRVLTASAGNFRSGSGSLTASVPLFGPWTSRFTVDAEREGFRDDRTAYRRGHGVWRVARGGQAEPRVWFGVDVNWLDQNPASPRPRVGSRLSEAVPLDANANPAGAFLNDHRATLFGGHERAVGSGAWSTTVSFSHAEQDILRGFLTRVDSAPNNARGLRQQIGLTDLYVDSHVAWRPAPRWSVLVGGDYLHGEGTASGADFTYAASLQGLFAPAAILPSALDVRTEDRRDFAGGYASVEWTPQPRLRIDAGIRLNLTREKRESGDEAGRPLEGEEGASTNTRASGSVGAIWTAWAHGADAVRLFANYRDTFKPAAVDFGIDDAVGGGGILKPETSRSVEGGVRFVSLSRRLSGELTSFLMNFNNLVVATSINGLPSLTNAGRQRFQGVEMSGRVPFPAHVSARATYSFHDATFRDYVQSFDGVPTQLAGKRLELSAHHLAATALTYAPPAGLFGHAGLNFVGSRFLNRRNTAPAEGFATLNASLGFRMARWELVGVGRNLTSRRDPVAESELGDAQYYLMPARRLDVRLAFRF